MFRLCTPAIKFSLVASALVGLAATLQAQEKVRIRNLKGEIKEVADGRLVMTDAKEKTDIAVLVPKRCEIDVEGTSDLAYLTPGVHVHFFADMTKANIVPDPLKEITVCTIDEEAHKPLCILADPTKKRNEGSDAVNQMEVRGTIKTIKNGKMTVDVPSERVKKQMVKLTLAPDAKVLVHFSDLSMAKPGDTVEIPSGMEKEPTLVIPSRKLIVKMANPLVAEKKTPPGRRTTAKSK